MSTVVNPHRRC